ncbi:cyclase family protein [Phanerochaete sordida]|uniref:Cyclase family protein n=1 Tax=Phanerochaete sordida TaxID=48140 RepID=A0A9P3GGR8_9APHY|nr:cyclase family protein [Phanerochaete sordida]
MAPQPKAIIDLSQPLVNGKVYACEGHPAFNACCISHVADGAFATVHSLSLATHTGTHVDAPYHFFADGARIDKLDLGLLTAAPAVVADLRAKGPRAKITWDDLAPYAPRMHRGVALVLCTGWSARWGLKDYTAHPYLDPAVADKLLATGVRVVACDMMSPDLVTDEEGDCGLFHRAWLGKGAIIVENLNGVDKLLAVDKERLRVSFTPLNIVDSDGSPVRAVGWEEG